MLRYAFLVVAVLATISAALFAGPLAKVQGVAQEPLVSVDLGGGTDVRKALRMTFAGTGRSYSIAPEVKGTVRGKFERVPLESVLIALTSQVGARIRTELNIYQFLAYTPFDHGYIEWRSSPISPDDSRLRLELQDDKFLYAAKGNELLKISKEDLVVVKRVQMQFIRIR